MEQLTGVVSWVQSKVDQAFGYFGFYTENYSKLLVYGFLMFVAAKIFKVKINVGK